MRIHLRRSLVFRISINISISMYTSILTITAIKYEYAG